MQMGHMIDPPFTWQAGQPNPVVDVASELEEGAIQGLMATPPCDEQKDGASRRPFVGIVDYVVVLIPICCMMRVACVN
jgi:hypothetical protein